MKTKAYLGQIERLNHRIKFKINELNNLKEMALVIKSAGCDDMKIQSGTKENHMENTIIAIADTEKELEKLIQTLIDKKHAIISEIEALENTNEYAVLIMRFVECKTISEIALAMNYSSKNIERILANAVENFTVMYGTEKGLVNKECEKSVLKV